MLETKEYFNLNQDYNVLQEVFVISRKIKWLNIKILYLTHQQMHIYSLQ